MLIIDDQVTLETFARMLHLDGYDVVTALSAEDGLRTAERCQPAIILADLRMPLVDGLQFLRRFRAQESRRRTPVAVVTGH